MSIFRKYVLMAFLLTGCGSVIKPLEYGTFIQPNNTYFTKTLTQWDVLFSQFQSMGITQVVIQYSETDSVSFLPIIDHIMHVAQDRRIKVWIGLNSPQNWWQEIAKNPDKVREFLIGLEQKQTVLGQALIRKYQNNDAFAGLYMPIEIDDGTWQNVQKDQGLQSSISRIVKKLSPHKVSISGFANGVLSPESLSIFWQNLFQNTGLFRLYFQDGVGVHKLSIDQAHAYFKQLNQAVEVTAVVETFTQTAGEPINSSAFKAIPAKISRLEKQVLSVKNAGVSSITFFSVPDYMSVWSSKSGQELGRQWEIQHLNF